MVLLSKANAEGVTHIDINLHQCIKISFSRESDDRNYTRSLWLLLVPSLMDATTKSATDNCANLKPAAFPTAKAQAVASAKGFEFDLERLWLAKSTLLGMLY
mmetsp:Transcript_37025/g.77569  ORF Transcript_37025/g.77569 Transcript_37025/m.77569 type:complete len:102 (+) Transcript_37025:358-663(+)